MPAVETLERFIALVERNEHVPAVEDRATGNRALRETRIEEQVDFDPGVRGELRKTYPRLPATPPWLDAAVDAAGPTPRRGQLGGPAARRTMDAASARSL
ncbi:MAG TPA: hypothetical protein VFQ20_13950 [Burkholderiaceae bacterium]|nr:hypothetical protein [Burkholderiaceae bacterium]